jgi:hypothetical protein
LGRQSDPFIKSRWEAEQLLRELEIHDFPIDPFDIARQLDIELRPLPANAGGASGMLLHVNGQFGIGYPTHIDSDGFKNFSVSHELGHFRLPGHLDAVLGNHGRHLSRAGFRSTDRYEQEADHFAATLLMPTKLFTATARRAGEGLSAIEVLADRCGTSLEATAIRYIQTNRDPVALVRSEGRTIDYAFMSESLKEFPNLDWIRKGTPLPADCVTARFNADKNNIERGIRAEGTSTLQDWFNGPNQQEIVEEVVGLGGYGKTLTILTGLESPDESEDDDLEEAWTPRFR